MNEQPNAFGPARIAVDAVWKSLTQNATAAFRSGDLRRAERLYADALQEAQWRFLTDRGATTMAGAPPMLIAASANAAECYACRGDARKAVRVTFLTLDAVRGAMSDPTKHPTFRQACCQHLKPALCEYAERVKAVNVAPDIFQQVVVQTRAAALAFLTENQTRH